MSRSFDIEGIDPNKISASYDNGVLELSIPKPVEEQTSSRKVEIQ